MIGSKTMSNYGYRKTVVACLLGAFSQAFVVQFAPLLFLTFQKEFGVPLSQITLLVTLNFTVQLLTDLLASRFMSKIGHRRGLILSQTLSAVGLASMAFTPSLFGGFYGLLVSVVIYAVGGGLIEVLCSPTIEACPVKNKAGLMSLTHGFYCWGVVICVLISTLFFRLFGATNWRYLACFWALIPAIDAILFAFAPLYTLDGDEAKKPNYKSLFANTTFWLAFFMMACSGAAEQAVSQWASAFAEQGLGVSKSLGDLLGLCGFAALMAISRTVYGKFSEKLPLKTALSVCAVLCCGGYLMMALSPSPVVGLIGCMLCGFSCGIFWPGTLSLSAQSIPFGGTAMFALLALAGDVGCLTGPTLVGALAEPLGMNAGFLISLAFPALLLCGVLLLRPKKQQPKLLNED